MNHLNAGIYFHAMTPDDYIQMASEELDLANWKALYANGNEKSRSSRVNLIR